MNDAGWSELRDLWQREQGRLPPDLQRHAARQARGLVVANIVFWTIVAGEGAVALWLLFRERGAPARLDGWVILGSVSILSAWFLAVQRRLWPKPLEIPSEMLARFDRQLSRSAASAWIGAGGFFALSLFALIQGATLGGGFGGLWSSSRAAFLQAFIALLCLAIWPGWVARRTRLRRERIRAWREEVGEAP